MTIGEHISAIRLRIQRYDDDSNYKDPAIYHLLKTSAAIINKQKEQQRNKLSDWNVNYYMIGMHKDSPYESDCIGDFCDKWITKFKIPRPLMGRNKALIDIRTLDGRSITRVGKDYSIDTLDPVKKDSILYDIINGYIVLYNSKPKAILIGGLWEDITDWEDIKLCDESGKVTNKKCFDITKDEFQVDTDRVNMMYDMVIQQLVPGVNITEDQQELFNENNPK